MKQSQSIIYSNYALFDKGEAYYKAILRYNVIDGEEYPPKRYIEKWGRVLEYGYQSTLEDFLAFLTRYKEAILEIRVVINYYTKEEWEFLES